MLAYMLDTDICIYIIKNPPPVMREEGPRVRPDAGGALGEWRRA